LVEITPNGFKKEVSVGSVELMVIFSRSVF
jgi:hypothetical protein